MTSAEKLRLLLIRDSAAMIAVTAYFYLPDPYNNLAIVGIVGPMWLTRKRFKGSTTMLDLRQRRYYFATICFFPCLWLVLVLIWILRHSSAPAWCMGSLGIIVILALIYGEYDRVLGRSPKV
jgi:hypothetical protein